MDGEDLSMHECRDFKIQILGSEDLWMQTSQDERIHGSMDVEIQGSVDA